MTEAENDELEPVPQDDEVDELEPVLQDDEVEATIDSEPDVLLDVSDLSVDEITLEVEDLHARVALQADVLELLKLHVGVDAQLGRVNLTIKGVQARALLKVRLDNVAGILDRVMTTIDNNPDLVERVLETAGEAVGEVGAGAASAVEGVGGAVADVAQDAGEVVEGVAEGAGRAVDGVAEEAPSDPGTEAAPEGRRRRRADASGTDRPKGSRPSRGRQPKAG